MGPGWSQCFSIHPVAGAGTGGSTDSEGRKESGGATRDVTIAYRYGRGRGGISKVTGALCLGFAPSSSLLPFRGLSLSPSLPPSPSPFCYSGVQPGTPSSVLRGRGQLLSPQDWEDSEQMSITCEFWVGRCAGVNALRRETTGLPIPFQLSSC